MDYVEQLREKRQRLLAADSNWRTRGELEAVEAELEEISRELTAPAPTEAEMAEMAAHYGEDEVNDVAA